MRSFLGKILPGFLFFLLSQWVLGQISTFPYQQGWETNSIGDWAQVSYDDRDWQPHSSGTPSLNTGPSGANEGTYYIYCETSGSANGDEFVLESPEFDFSALLNPRFVFDYHMYFNNFTDGTLNIDISTDLGSSWSTIHTITGSQQADETDPWLTGEISLLSYAGESSVKFRFFFTTGTGTSHQYDMAIDYVEVKEGPPLLALDAGIVDITAPTGPVAAGTPTPVRATIKNFGTTTLTSADICFSVNGGATQFTAWTGSLVLNAEDVDVYIDDAVFNVGVNTLKVWTKNPNLATDMQASNDTLEIIVNGEPSLSGIYTVGAAGADFTSFTNSGGVFETVNSTLVSGDLIFEVISDITNESGLHALHQWTESGVGNYTMTIRPDGNTLRLVEGNYQGTGYDNEGLFRLDGVSRVIFDGRDPGNLSGGGRFLCFRNTNGSSYYYQSTFTFLNGSYEDTLQYIIVEGAAFLSNVGIVRFGRYLKGNHDILIDNCQIRDLSTTGAATGSGIYSTGVSSTEPNYNITISNNEIFNMWRGGTDNAGIYLTSYNKNWTIIGNHIYLNGAKSATGNSMKYGIYLSYTGENMIVSGNYIGGSQPFCGGTPWVYTMSGDKNTRFCGIYVKGDNPSYSYLIENNTIKNIEWKHSYYSTSYDVVPFTGIHSANGNNIIRGNCIGESIGTESILVHCGAAGQLSLGDNPLYSYGIIVESGNVLVENNTIGSIKFVPYDAADDAALEFTGIYISDKEPGGGDNVDSAMVIGNTIGSETTPLSIETTAPSIFNGNQAVSGIYLGSHGVNIARNNIIANLHNGNNYYYTHSNTYGIYTNFYGKKLIENNRIFSLSNNAYHTITDYNSSVVGIKYFSNTNTIDSIIDNEIYDLRNTTSNKEKVGVCGIGITATTKYSPGSVEVARNIIHSFDVNTTEDYAALTGIHFYAKQINVYNNFIRLGIDKDGNSVDKNLIITGIKQSSNNCVVAYNTVYIGGTVAGGDTSSWAFKRTTAGWSAPQPTDLYNNIFINERNNSSAVNTHFSVGFQMVDNFNPVENYITELNSDYNLFYSASGTVAETGVGEFNTLSDWQAYFSKDLNSISGDVNFVDDTGPAATVDLHIDTSLPSIVESAGTVIAGIGDDIDLELRFGTSGTASTGTAPDVGADEINFSSLPVVLLNFNATCDNGNVHLYWATATEINNDYFIVEYSSNLEDWQEIIRIDGAGFSSTNREYSALHIPENSGIKYYRLLQVDYDGSVKQYEPVSCLCDFSKEFSIFVYPNPLKDILFISKDETIVYLFIMDHMGRVVYSDVISEQHKSIDLSTLSAGQYILKVISQSKTETIQIQKL